MSLATASQPAWTTACSPRIEDTQHHRRDHIDVSSALGPYRVSRFRRNLAQWRAETYYLSSVTAKTQHPALKDIVVMGEWAVPWIIEELRTHRDFLFVALHLIVKEDPTPASAKGDPHALIEAWLQWAERENISPD